MKKIIPLTFLAIVLISCGGDNKETATISVDTPQGQQVETTNVIDLKGTDDMKYDHTKFTIKAGEEVTLNFTNAGVLPLETMGHNVVILEKDADVQTFANASARAKETGYIDQAYITDIIAQTKLLGPGESDTITFSIKEPGEYTYICTFPGHWIQMKGTITVVK